MRALLRHAAYQFGILSMERTRVRDALTVVMFHRVIGSGDPELVRADPAYTINADLFDELLEFFQDHYAVVSLIDLMNAVDCGQALPDYPLLITFDDGWADNLQYAVPRLKRRGLPAVIFVVAEALISTSNAWWQEEIFAAARRGDLSPGLGPTPMGIGELDGENLDPFEVVCRLGVLGEKERSRLLASLETPRGPRMMLSPADLPHLMEAGIAVGIHGYSHLPLTRVGDIEDELRRARETIASLTSDATSATALACPHGRYNARVLSAAQATGVRLIFTSDAHLNRSIRSPIGRISIGSNLVKASGRLDPAVAATWLWRRPCV
jgi:peptidoglycan/xylan/chitin deacetylase (PgdA/CDA1 family)